MKPLYVLHAPAASALGEQIARGLGGTALPLEPGSLQGRFRELWDGAGALILVGSLPVAVRAAGPLLRDKATDPTVLCVSEDGGTVLAVAGGHLGGGADLAQRCAALLGAGWIPTTSTDRRGLTAPDRWARRHGLSLRGREALPGLLRSLLDQGSLPWWIDPLLAPFSEDPLASPLPLPFGARPVAAPEGARVLVSPRRIPLPEGAIQLVPPLLGAGVGCRRGAKRDTLLEALDGALEEAPGGPFLREALGALATLEAKAQEPGLEEAARTLGLPLSPLSPETLRAQEGPFSPSAAQRHFHVPGVAEPCAAALGSPLGPRLIRDGVTVALSRIPFPAPRGSLAVVGTGPGSAECLTQEARSALEGADAVVGYRLYVDLLPPACTEGRHVERYAMGEEEDRVRRALDLAERGHRVALVCGGDPILFGLAALALRLGADRVPVRVVPGITAAQRAGTLLGAPYTNGLCLLSLSDYLQPWSSVERALEAAAAGGLTTVLYNPVRRDLGTKLAAVRRAFRRRPTALLCRDVDRPDQTVEALPLEALTEDRVDMRTLVVLPGEGVEPWKGLWLDRRGYGSEEVREPALPQDPLDVLVLGGTSEAREVAERLRDRGLRVGASVAEETGLVTVPQGVVPLVGRRDTPAWIPLLEDRKRAGLAALVDAAHPFAQEAHQAFRIAARRTGLPLWVLRRPTPVPEGALAVASPEALLARLLESTRPGDLLVLTLGVRLLPRLVPPLKAQNRRLLARVLPTPESLDAALATGLEPREVLCQWGPGDEGSLRALLEESGARALVSKASGAPGGLEAKARAARSRGIPLVVLTPPPAVGTSFSTPAALTTDLLDHLDNRVEQPFA